MQKSFFIQLVQKWFPTIAKKITETINGKKEEPTYLHEQMLQREYSADLRWDSASIDGSIVAADIVSMDSSLPAKSRDSMGMASGDIPKLGMKLSKGEKLITDMQIMSGRGATEAQIVAKLFADAPRCAKGVKERNEAMFLQGIQSGVILIEDTVNVGTAIRADYGYLARNKFGASIKWGNAGYTPLSDIANVISKASDESDVIRTICLSKNDFDGIRRSNEAIDLSANFRGLTITDNGRLPVPSKSQFLEAFADEYGVNLLVIDRSIKTEKNGKRTSKKIFSDGTLVFLTTEPTDKVGRLVYGSLAEEKNPVDGVVYEKVDEYILLSKYSKNDPLCEFTSSQALCIPVIDNVESIYTLSTQEAQEASPAEVEGDDSITVYGKKVAKAGVITAIKSIGVACAVNISDAKLIERINGLSEDDKTKLHKLVELMSEATA